MGRSAGEIVEFCRSAGYECSAVQARDRFGDYGLVGVMIYRAGEEVVEVDLLDTFGPDDCGVGQLSRRLQ